MVSSNREREPALVAMTVLGVIGVVAGAVCIATGAIALALVVVATFVLAELAVLFVAVLRRSPTGGRQ